MLRSNDELEYQIKKIADKHGHIDFLINNAGITFKSRAEEFPEERLDAIININLKTPFYDFSIMLSLFERITLYWKDYYYFIYASYMGFNGVLPYDMTKSGVMGLTRGLAEEWKNDNILVNSVSPGWVLTKMNEEMFAKNPDRKEAAANKMMLPRFAEPD